MNDMCVYRIQLRGVVDEIDVNAMSPLQMTGQGVVAAGTYFSVHTDQSGLVGLLRHLHDQGFLLLSFQRSEEAAGWQAA